MNKREYSVNEANALARQRLPIPLAGTVKAPTRPQQPDLLRKDRRCYHLALLEMSILRSIAVFLCGFSFRICVAQVPFLGNCPDVRVMPAFDPSRYLGKWYEAERYFAVFQLEANASLPTTGKRIME
ncbi:hypothetical protein EVAR_8194_1 [Eumeta japonica]|uniref:Apolipoprotein D n=1 Tax=Eumeta variegata TaxID=151549 RepID=A0A4C1TIK6_EUMVA|nr:hypothetical protein EVAR_8194_1 [Eumeta japonica]